MSALAAVAGLTHFLGDKRIRDLSASYDGIWVTTVV